MEAKSFLGKKKRLEPSYYWHLDKTTMPGVWSDPNKSHGIKKRSETWKATFQLKHKLDRCYDSNDFLFPCGLLSWWQERERDPLGFFSFIQRI